MNDHDDKQEQCFAAFQQGTEEVLIQVLEVPVEQGEVLVVDSPVAILEVAVIIGLTGDLDGRVIFEFNREAALKIASVMNFGEEFESLDDSMARATLSELGNLIGGRAVTLFNDGGNNLSISTPMLMCGLGIRTSDQQAVRKISVKTECGEVLVNLSVRAGRQGMPGKLAGGRFASKK